MTAPDLALEKSLARHYAAPREVDPAVTLARLRPLLRAMGITRVANITGLDELGLPVVNVIRPNARSLSAAQGKGLDLDAAKVSGVMEAIEAHCAEHILQPLKYASATEMARRHRLPDMAALPQPVTSRFTPDTPILWIEGLEVCGQQVGARETADDASVWVPFELVHVNYTLPAVPGAGCFLLSSNGLASGNTADEALAHGLCELVERDASALFDADPRLLDRRRVDLRTLDDPYCRALIGRLQASGIIVALWDMTGDIGLATFRCHLMECHPDPAKLPLPAGGEGCHPDRLIALLRALTEAAQARLAVIAGVRDDIGPDLYGRTDDPDNLEAWRHLLAAGEGRRHFAEIPHQPLATAAAEVAYVVACLHDAGLPPPLAVDLSPADLISGEADAFKVMRVVVPGLEPPGEAACRPGRRLLAARRAAAKAGVTSWEGGT
ncbi:MAG TPA: YcaO-like family protein [Dongiaceae bacterium]|nr:YcaO-like family protein [Dongiaceae bacterium]